MTHGSLFSGIGGFDLAAEWMGWENVFQVEWDEYCQKVLRKNFPNTNIYGDIKEFDGTKYRGTIDIISGGFPCQPFSTAGKRKGHTDDRYLWPEYYRVIREINPEFIVAENVTGIINMELDQVLSDLENEGYSTWTFIIPACAVGANHRRDRVWIVAYSASNRQQGNKRETNTQKSNYWTFKALGAQHWNSSPFKNWEKLMGKSELCRMDDGISSTMDIRPRLHAYGNAIVPQVALEIFKAIDAINNQKEAIESIKQPSKFYK